MDRHRMGRHRRLREAQGHPMGNESPLRTAETTESASAAVEVRNVD
jgi:hypothetical protein